ncbi:MAG: Crp/Fnr family transcriptional regulator [Paracoccaceae bacterium]
MLDRGTGIRKLKEVGWLAATPQPFRDAVVNRCAFRDFAKGEWIYHFGEVGDGLWGVVDGGVHVEFTQGIHAPRTGIFATAGFWTGEGSLIAREPRTVGIRATRPTLMAHLSQAAFFSIAAEQPEAWRWVGLLAFFHMVNLIGLREDLCLREPEARVVATLCRMTASHWGGPGDMSVTNGKGATIDLNQGDLAELCNVSRAYLAHLFSGLKREGLVEPGYGSVRVPNPAALRGRLNVEN